MPRTRKNTSKVSSLALALKVWTRIFNPGLCLVSLNSLFKTGQNGWQSQFVFSINTNHLPKYSDDWEELQNISILDVLCNVLQKDVQVETESCNYVDKVDEWFEELQRFGSNQEADSYLESEPGVADCLDVEEGGVGVCPVLVKDPVRSVVDTCNSATVRQQH